MPGMQDSGCVRQGRASHYWHQNSAIGKLHLAGCCRCMVYAKVQVNTSGVPFVLDQGQGRIVLERVA